MYRCQQCGSDVSEEVEAEITRVAASLGPGQTPYGLYDYFEKRYVCKACEKGASAASLPASAGFESDGVVDNASRQFDRMDQKKVALGELVRILSLVDSPPNLRSTPQPGDLGRFDAWFDGGAIDLGQTGGLTEYRFADGVRVDWAGLWPRLEAKVEWPDGRIVKIMQEADPAAETAQTAIDGDRKNIGRYEITGPLGRWMYGPVHAGVDPASRRRVAIKTLLKGTHDDGFAAPYYKCLLREGLVGERVKHAGVVQALEYGEDGDIAYVALEFLDAKKLETYFDEDERIQIDDVVSIMGDLCGALEAVHEAGIVHSDLQPANVVIAMDGSAKLTNFSLAYLSGPDSHLNERELTDITENVPTPDYRSPEAISGDVIDRRADLFSAGILLYQLATGKKPFPGASPWTVAKKILEDDPLPPSSLNKELSAHFDVVVAKALAKHPADRYQTAPELYAALQAVNRKA